MNLKIALAGTRTRIDRVAGDHSTLRPPVQVQKKVSKFSKRNNQGKRN